MDGLTILIFAHDNTCAGNKACTIAMGMHLLPAWYGAKENHQAEEEGVAEILDELHLRKIDLADEVFVANVGGYIGERTQIEIAYALSIGKPLRYLESRGEGDRVV